MELWILQTNEIVTNTDKVKKFVDLPEYNPFKNMKVKKLQTENRISSTYNRKIRILFNNELVIILKDVSNMLNDLKEVS